MPSPHQSLSKRRFPTSQSQIQWWEKFHQSLSKRRFPTSQSAVNDLPRHDRESIKEAIPNQPKPNSRREGAGRRVYQRGDSQPAKASDVSSLPRLWSLSKRRFPTSQSSLAAPSGSTASLSKRRFPTSQSGHDDPVNYGSESIKEAIPNQPKPATGSGSGTR